LKNLLSFGKESRQRKLYALIGQHQLLCKNKAKQRKLSSFNWKIPRILQNKRKTEKKSTLSGAFFVVSILFQCFFE
jgi:hypothetical protein